VSFLPTLYFVYLWFFPFMYVQFPAFILMHACVIIFPHASSMHPLHLIHACAVPPLHTHACMCSYFSSCLIHASPAPHPCMCMPL
jgi:hypothetical protein